jgi:hypothetical protein
MKLDAMQKGRIEDKFGTEAVADDLPVVDQLKQMFGDHTFFVDSDGLNIIEPSPDAGAQIGTMVKLASWNEDRSLLEVHEPEDLSVRVDLSSGGSGSAS